MDASDEVPLILIELQERSAPKELPVRTMRTFPGNQHGALIEDTDEIMRRSYETAPVTVPIWSPTVTAMACTALKPRETLQYMLVEACQLDFSHEVVPMATCADEPKVPKNAPLT